MLVFFELMFTDLVNKLYFTVYSVKASLLALVSMYYEAARLHDRWPLLRNPRHAAVYYLPTVMGDAANAG